MPTDQCWRDGYDDSYCWVPPMMDKLMLAAMARALGAAMPTGLIENIRLDVPKRASTS